MGKRTGDVRNRTRSILVRDQEIVETLHSLCNGKQKIHVVAAAALRLGLHHILHSPDMMIAFGLSPLSGGNGAAAESSPEENDGRVEEWGWGIVDVSEE